MPFALCIVFPVLVSSPQLRAATSRQQTGSPSGGGRSCWGWHLLTANGRKVQNRVMGAGSGVTGLMLEAVVSRTLWAGCLTRQMCPCCWSLVLCWVLHPAGAGRDPLWLLKWGCRVGWEGTPETCTGTQLSLHSPSCRAASPTAQLKVTGPLWAQRAVQEIRVWGPDLPETSVLGKKNQQNPLFCSLKLKSTAGCWSSKGFHTTAELSWAASAIQAAFAAPPVRVGASGQCWKCAYVPSRPGHVYGRFGSSEG